MSSPLFLSFLGVENPTMIFWRALFTPFGHWQTPGCWSQITNVTKTFFFEIGHLRHPISDRTCRHPRIVFPHTLFAVFFRNRTQTRTSETSDHKSDLLGCKRQSRTVAYLLVAQEPLVGKIVHHVWWYMVHTHKRVSGVSIRKCVGTEPQQSWPKGSPR